MTQKKRSVIHVISDSTGETAERVVRSALAQFQRSDIDIISHVRVRKVGELETVFQRAEEDGSFVVYTLVDPGLREHVMRLAQDHQVEALDPIGALMARMAGIFGTQPEGRPGILHSLDDAYFHRIEAVEYAVKHDDGQMPQGLHKADVVIVGLSRTSKTPVCTYLAQKGIKAANVPVVLGIPLPRELFEIEQHRIVALTINVASLVRIRRARLKHLNMSQETDYGMREHIIKELKYAREIFRENPIWPVVDVSQKALEETASIITWMFEERHSALQASGPLQGPDRFSGIYTE